MYFLILNYKELSGGFRGGSGGSLEPLSETKLFQFHGEIYENSGRMLKMNPPWRI